MRRVLSGLLVIAVAGLPAVAAADDLFIPGKKIAVANRGTPEQRKVTVVAGKSNHSLPIFGAPWADGGSATLIVTLEGASPTTQSFFLPQGTRANGRPFWRAVNQSAGGGYLYTDPGGEQGPVVKVLVKTPRTSNGIDSSYFKAIVKGSRGPVTLVPPDPGTQAFVVLDITGGARYCIPFVGGEVRNDADRLFAILNGGGTTDCPA